MERRDIMGDLAWWLIMRAEEQDEERIPPSWDEWVLQRAACDGGIVNPMQHPAATDEGARRLNE
jgi:hypothetical protein